MLDGLCVGKLHFTSNFVENVTKTRTNSVIQEQVTSASLGVWKKLYNIL